MMLNMCQYMHLSCQKLYQHNNNKVTKLIYLLRCIFVYDSYSMGVAATRATKMVLVTVSSTPVYFTYNNS